MTAMRERRSTGNRLAPASRHLALLLLLATSCGGPRVPPSTEGPTAASEDGQRPQDEATATTNRCYPYLAKAGGECPSRCGSIDDCAGSRGPADFAENGWPLDCVGGECVPLPPDSVQVD